MSDIPKEDEVWIMSTGERREVIRVNRRGDYVKFHDKETGEYDEMDLMTFKHLHEKEEPEP